ncbi:DUF6891 domain-containing protein [Corynebacterium striatum]|uniref:DUF6891 domain-containing protein n=1 Tax=Corynebacterium striatum TaxID=43770 RepID=A0ABC9ZNK9_CORST|nr:MULTISPECIES: hypothetical protein [Corynebacterium]EEI78422.1 hypothetical protein HMPREF0308_1280 [Corynebacterium striatum ATCC 6940]MBD0856637.1 hypothetical protein [Corynebacterium striatum]MDC7107303.1 hypothetical protein [Corynebacterium striatum]MDK8813225.1 hypothetical protein [Corynebacterium striatum]NHY10528.1 hypothetical protein [Corynebacterium striatum]
MEISDSLRQQLNHWILPGFMTLDEVYEAVDDNELEDGYPNDDPHAAAEQVWKERKAQESEREHPTDYDLVQAAFDEMEEQGLVTGMSLGFDVSDCNELLGEERTQIDVPEGEYPYREWASCGFHMQDAEGLAYEPTELNLVFGAWTPGPPIAGEVDAEKLRKGQPERKEEWARMDAALGRFLLDILKRHDLEVEWDGDPRGRIQLLNLM